MGLCACKRSTRIAFLFHRLTNAIHAESLPTTLFINGNKVRLEMTDCLSVPKPFSIPNQIYHELVIQSKTSFWNRMKCKICDLYMMPFARNILLKYSEMSLRFREIFEQQQKNAHNINNKNNKTIFYQFKHTFLGTV